ncbi:hypothetical protein D1159_07145 [Pseudoflavonifractor sp. 524-17]|uniref:hypothetical protein n=1 Tax=Pseudoflavonifractor sp. 524-17 TaxID=2304577 RepID=UPI0013799E49|nr:hypothetical protein [Pseudoflavonifractor sp. 524-17]NCE64369.1 hypothetical protein [Pseudoflavonifractor sp. 524-17]
MLPLISGYGGYPSYWSSLSRAGGAGRAEAAQGERPGDVPALSADSAVPPVTGAAEAEGQDGLRNDLQGRDTGECETCKNRKYQDGSSDPGVSFKTPTRLSPEEAASMVRAHEMEHVVRNQQKALREERKVVSQSVTYHTAICPECGRVYVSGGTTRTVTQNDDRASLFQIGIPQEETKGKNLSLTA